MSTELDINQLVYRTGTLTIAPGDTTAVFTGAAIASGPVREGDWLFAGNGFAFIESLTSDAEAELFLPWAGGAVTDGAYVILKASFLRYLSVLLAVDTGELIAMLNQRQIFYNVPGAAPDPSIGKEGDFAIKTNSGTWLLWRFISGAWELQATPVGANWTGQWNAATDYVVNDTAGRNGSTYISKTINTNKPPETNPDDWDLSAAKGDPGRDGGVIAIPYIFDGSATGNTDPGAGKLRLGPGASQSAAVVWRVNPVDSAGLDWTGTIIDLAAGTSSVKCAARLYRVADQTKRIVANVTAINPMGGYFNLVVASTSGDANPFTNGEAFVLVLDRNGDKGNQGIQGIQGPKGANFRGPWAGGAFFVDDVVTRSGSSYIAIQDGNDQDPLSAPLYWSLFAAKGDQGLQGPQGLQGLQGTPGTNGSRGAQWRGAHSSLTNYAIDDWVSFGGKVYISLQAGSNHQPDVSPTYWQLFFDPNAPVDSIVVQPVAGAKTAAAGDRATLLKYTAGATLALTAAATLGNGWYCFFKITGGALIIDPDGSELIDNAASVTIPAGGSGFILCNGTGFETFIISSGGGFSSAPEFTYTADHAVVAADQGKVLTANKATAISFTLLALSAAGAGFAFIAGNKGVGTLAIDPDAAETIEVNGVVAAALTLEQGEQAFIYAGDGAASWKAIVIRSEGHIEPETDVATGATMDIGATNTERVRATGTTGPITSFGSRKNKRRKVRWTSAVSVTYHATSMILPGGASLTTENGAIWTCESDASGNWRVVDIQGNSPPARGKLTAARNYYVRPDGSNSNDGLANTTAGAFLTIQKAIDVVYGTLDLGGFNVNINVAAGTYASFGIGSPQVGSGNVTVIGDTATPANVLINSSGSCVVANNYAVLSVQGLKFVSSAGNGLVAFTGATVNVTGKVEFGACAVAHMSANTQGTITGFVNYIISGAATYHYQANIKGTIRFQVATVTMSGTLAFTTFAQADDLSLIYANANTYTGGTVTGKRYEVNSLSEIYTGGGGASYFPGNAAGTNSTGGQPL